MSVSIAGNAAELPFLPFLLPEERCFYDRSLANRPRGTVGTLIAHTAWLSQILRPSLGTQRFLPSGSELSENRASLPASPPVRGESGRRKGGTELAGARTDDYKHRHADPNRSKNDD